jgi:hypothetical protein
MISWSRIAVVINFSALAASHHLEPSGLGNKRVALAAEITTFEAALDSHGQKTRGLDPERLMRSAPVSCQRFALPAAP